MKVTAWATAINWISSYGVCKRRTRLIDKLLDWELGADPFDQSMKTFAT